MLHVIKQIVDKKFLPWYSDYEETAMPDEKDGLHLIEYIIKNRGQSRYTGPLSVDKGANAQIKSGKFDLKASMQILRKKEITSSYDEHYGYIKKILKPRNNIFAYKRCQDLEFKEWMIKQVAIYIDSWILLKDDLRFQDQVLKALRSLNARYLAHAIPTSEQRGQYHVRNADWRQSRPARLDKLDTQKKLYKKDMNAEFKQKLKREGMLGDIEKMIKEEENKN